MPGSPATTTDGRTTGTTCGGKLQSRSSTASSRTRQHDHHHHEPKCPSVTSTLGPEALVGQGHNHGAAVGLAVERYSHARLDGEVRRIRVVIDLDRPPSRCVPRKPIKLARVVRNSSYVVVVEDPSSVLNALDTRDRGVGRDEVGHEVSR